MGIILANIMTNIFTLQAIGNIMIITLINKTTQTTKTYITKTTIIYTSKATNNIKMDINKKIWYRKKYINTPASNQKFEIVIRKILIYANIQNNIKLRKNIQI